MNLSLSYLSLISSVSNSPVFSYNGQWDIKVTNSRFKKHFSNFFLGFPNQFLVKKSSFTDFLSSPIYLSTYNPQERKIFTRETPCANIVSSSFQNCNDFRGGAIYSECYRFNITDCLFTKNTAKYGACVYSVNFVGGKVTNTLFLENKATVNCAGMFIDCISKDPKILDITNTNFTRNVGVTNGALMLWGGEQHMSHIYVDNCQSTKSLAAICTSSYATATIDSSTIVNCTSNYRGSALSSFTIGTKLKVTNTKLLNNDLGKANFATFYTRNDQIKIDFIDCVIECKNFENQFGEKKKMKFLVLTNVKVIERGNNQTVINTNGMATNK